MGLKLEATPEHGSTSQAYLGSISPTHCHKAQMRRRIAFVQKDAVQFHQQNCAQLYWYIELENLPSFYAVSFVPYTSKLGVNLLAQKLFIK